jgi:diadenosine tetraphosphate (Ap4A) HIT family hydrolase
MPITDDQAKSIKEQIIKQIESTFPAEKKDSAISYVKSLDNPRLEEFVMKNKLVQQEQGSHEKSPHEKPGCIYCMIAEKKVDSLPIYEDKDYVAVLEINPFSNGHTILIPKAHIKETRKIKSKALTIAKKIGSHISKRLKSKDFQISTSDELGHAIINIIPIYGEAISTERKRAKPEELKDTAMQIGKLEKKTREKKPEKEPSEKPGKSEKSKIISLPRRIP